MFILSGGLRNISVSTSIKSEAPLNPILYLVIIVCEKISSMSKNLRFIIGIGILKYRRGRDRMVDLWIDHYLCNQ